MKEWYSNIGGNYRYGKNIKFDQNVNTGSKVKKLSDDEITSIKNENYVTKPIVDTNNGSMLNDCTSHFISECQ